MHQAASLYSIKSLFAQCILSWEIEIILFSEESIRLILAWRGLSLLFEKLDLLNWLEEIFSLYLLANFSIENPLGESLLGQNLFKWKNNSYSKENNRLSFLQ